MNSYFYKIFMPYTLLALLGLVLSWQHPEILAGAFVAWVLVGFLGTGVGFHRLFSHRAFETYKPIEYALGLLGTLSAYGPLLYWCGNHHLHHKVADTPEDPTSPLHGFWHSAITWNLKKQCETQVLLKNKPCLRIMKDRFLMWLSKYFVGVNYITLIALACVSYKLALALALATWLERLRIGVVTSYFLHLPNNKLSYRNYDTKDWSRNSHWLVPLAWGFAYHNNHHARPGAANDGREKFELDLEYLVIRVIRKRKQP